jgi:hypothetical protein
MFLTVAPMAALGVVVVAWWLGPGAVSVKLDQHVANAAFDLNDIERLRAEAELHERVARELVSQRKRDAAREQVRLALLRTDPLDDVREQVDVVAYRMVMRADDLQTRMDPEAIDVYRDVVQLFPNTSSAELARQRLTQLGLSDGES